MDEQLCLIWYSNICDNNAKLKWSFSVWPSCFVDWIETKVRPGFIASRKSRHNNRSRDLTSTIPCVNFCWSDNNKIDNSYEVHELTHTEWLKFVSDWSDRQAYDRFVRCMLDVITTQENDFRRCPGQGWDYIGTISHRPSNRQLVCEKWGYQWDDPSLYPLAKKLYRGFTNCFSLNSEHLNSLQKVMRGEPWPNCGICIFKLDGWNHMVWASWGYEFWWMCLGHYPSYRHTEQTFCPLRNVIISAFVVYLLIFSVDIKLWLRFETLKYYQQIVLDWAVFVSSSNVYAWAAFLEITFVSFASENRELMIYFPQYEAVYKQKYYNYLVLSLLYPVAYFGASVVWYIYFEYFRNMVFLVINEAMMCAACSCIFGLLFCIYRLLWVRHDEILYEDPMSLPSADEGKLCCIMFSWAYSVDSRARRHIVAIERPKWYVS